MADRPLKSTAKLWAGAKRPDQKYRDRQRIQLPDGRRIEVFGYGRTMKAATADLQSKISARTAEPTSAETITVTQVMAMLLRSKQKLQGRKRGTIQNYAGLYRRHIMEAIGSRPIAAVTLDELQAIQLRLVEAGHYRTAQQATILLRSLWTYALRTYAAEIRAGRVHLYDVARDLDPVKAPAGSRAPKGEAWTPEQLAAFLKASQAKYERSVSNLYYPVFYTALAAGLRRGELLGLRRQDLVSSNGAGGPWLLCIQQQFTYVNGKHRLETPKTASGRRRVPIGPDLAELLQGHVARLDRIAKQNPAWQASDLLLPSYNGTPIEPRNLYRALHQLVDELGLPRVTLHELRSLYATYVTKTLVQQGRYSPKLVMQLLGHSHPHVALQHYTRVVEEDLLLATFEPTAGISAGTGAKAKDAVPVETAS